MTLKFNPYDIYGFALPGFLLLAVLWLPFGLIDGVWPDAELSSALVMVIIAYFVGHILQTVAMRAIPSNFIGGRYPSSVFLDEANPTFSAPFKEKLARQIDNAFGLNINAPAGELEIVRRDAFFLARSALIKNKTIQYAEQFEGLYALMRGLSTAFALAVVYYLGWASSGLLQFVKTFRFVPHSWWSREGSGLVILVGIIVGIAALINAHRFKYAKPLMIWSLGLATFAAGYYLGLGRVGVSVHRSQLIAVAVFSFFASERCYAGYKGFAQEFAKAVYRDFSTSENTPVAPEEIVNNDDDAD